jgi:hypothetical protein
MEDGTFGLKRGGLEMLNLDRSGGGERAGGCTKLFLRDNYSEGYSSAEPKIRG